MKHFFCLGISMLFWGAPAWSQNWQPMSANELYNYEIPLVSPIAYDYDTLLSAIHTLGIDSAGLTGTDSIFFLRLSYVSTQDTAIAPCVNNTGSTFAYPQPLFLQKALIRRNNGIYECIDPLGNATFLHTWAALNDSWTWDTAQNITATISSVAEITFLGVVDSVKTIDFSNGKSAVLSKSHGFVEYAHPTDNRVYRLIGLEQMGVGEQIPQYEDFYSNYEVGDVLMYSWWQGMDDPGNQSYGYHKATITAKGLQGGSVFYGMQLLSFEHIENSMIGINQDFSYNRQDTVFAYNVDNNGSIFNDAILCDHQLPHAYDGQRYLYTSSAFGGEVEGLARTFRNQRQNKVRWVATISHHLQDTFRVDCETEIFEERWGHYMVGLQEPLANISILRMGYIHNGDTVGTILSDSLMLVSVQKNIQNTTEAPLVFPNPSNSDVFLQWQTPTNTALHLVLYNLQGQQVFQAQLPEYQTFYQLPLQHLPAGLYMLTLNNPASGHTFSSKILKL